MELPPAGRGFAVQGGWPTAKGGSWLDDSHARTMTLAPTCAYSSASLSPPPPRSSESGTSTTRFTPSRHAVASGAFTTPPPEVMTTSRSWFAGAGGLKGARVLEIGAGLTTQAFWMVEEGAHVTGIDISDVVVEKTRVRARELGVQDSCDFQVMDAENLSFAPDSFDVVCGNSVIHHIDLELAYANSARVLKPQGRAVWREPLGHNPLLNAFRRLTPQMRTDDEHPLVMDDLKLAERWFSSIDARFFHLTTPAAHCVPELVQVPSGVAPPGAHRCSADARPPTRATPLRVVRGRADGQAGLEATWPKPWPCGRGGWPLPPLRASSPRWCRPRT